jgi:hypothetical protein
MDTIDNSNFDLFAAEFVRAYWRTLKNGDFPMPPNEPVEETVEELIAAVSHEIEMNLSSVGSKSVYRLRMISAFGSWWVFSFVRVARGWRLVGAKASSLDPARPHDLLGAVYGPDFEPFLRHVTEISNEQMII